MTPITNHAGQVALRHYKTGTVLLQNNPSGAEYVARISHRICMVWVDPVDVERIFQIKQGCCGTKNHRPAFSYATQTDVDTWEGRNEPP